MSIEHCGRAPLLSPIPHTPTHTPRSGILTLTLTPHRKLSVSRSGMRVRTRMSSNIPPNHSKLRLGPSRKATAINAPLRKRSERLNGGMIRQRG